MTIEQAIKFAQYAPFLSQEPEVREFYRMCEKAIRAQQKIPDSEIKTNGDRIRAMTDEELATVIMCPCDNTTGLCGTAGCIDCCLDWLKQPAEVE